MNNTQKKSDDPMKDSRSVFRPAIRKMHPYKPPLDGRSSDHSRLLLDFNERTRPVAQHLVDRALAYVEENRYHVYPEYGDILEKIGQYAGVDSSQVLITNGSDHGIDLIYRSVAEPGDEAIVPVPTFAMLSHCAEVCGLNLKTPHYTKENGYPLEEVKSLITDKTRVITVCNPNSPTGTLLAVEGIVELAQAARHSAILVDECYFEYCGETVKDYLTEYPNIFITRTFSKTWGLSAFRLGYILSHPDNIEEFLKVRGPYDMNTMAIAIASAALDDPDYMFEYCREVVEEAKPLLLSYLDKKNIEYWPTESNFVLLKPENAVAFEQHLRDNNIYVRPIKGPGIEGTVRITFGPVTAMERLISVLEEIL